MKKLEIDIKVKRIRATQTKVPEDRCTVAIAEFEKTHDPLNRVQLKPFYQVILTSSAN